MSEAIAQKLDEARALIEKGWCQAAFAKTASGTICHETDGAAVCFCSGGAIFRVVDRSTGLRSDVIEALKAVVGGVVDWNDAPERTQAEVIEAFKKAAELARGDL